MVLGHLPKWSDDLLNGLDAYALMADAFPNVTNFADVLANGLDLDLDLILVSDTNLGLILVSDTNLGLILESYGYRFVGQRTDVR